MYIQSEPETRIDWLVKSMLSFRALGCSSSLVSGNLPNSLSGLAVKVSRRDIPRNLHIGPGWTTDLVGGAVGSVQLAV